MTLAVESVGLVVVDRDADGVVEWRDTIFVDLPVGGTVDVKALRASVATEAKTRHDAWLAGIEAAKADPAPSDPVVVDRADVIGQAREALATATAAIEAVAAQES